MGQIGLTTSLIMIGLFSIAIISFAVNFAIDNDAAISVADDTDINNLKVRTQGNLSEYRSGSEDTYSSLVNTTVAPGSGVIASTAPFAITPSNAVGVSTNILKVAYKKIFGSDSGFAVFLFSIIAMLVFMVALYIYKTWRGNPN